MPKLPDDPDGSELRMFKIYGHFWPVLAIPPRRLLDFVLPMKRSSRPLLTIVLLVVFVATFSCRTLVRRGLLSIELENKALVQEHVFNATLLKYAAIEIGEQKSKQEIQQLLDGNFDSRGRYRTFLSWRRFHHDVSGKTSRGMPATLRSPMFYKYWLAFRRALQSWVRDKKFQPNIMLELVRLVKHPIDKHNALEGSDQRYSSCAVVGNSGILLNSDHGELIDSHEAVIRMNNAKIDGYKQKVGSKTSISFVNSNILHLCARKEGCFCHPYGDEVPIVMYVCQPVHFLDYVVCNTSHKAPLLVTDARFDMLCSRIVKYYSLKIFAEKTGKPLEDWGAAHGGFLFHYSSGMQAVMLALGICDKVSIFGFGKSAYAKHHYHTNQKAELHLHDYEAEYAFYHDLIERPSVIPFLSDQFKVPPVIMYH